MLYQISSDNMDLTERMQTLGKDKVSSLKKFFAHLPPDEANARVVLNKASQDETFEVKIDLVAKGKNYFAQEKDFALETCLIHAVEEIERQLEKDRDENERDWKKQREMKFAGGEEYVEEI
jgi:ribosomal subunit interface protein